MRKITFITGPAGSGKSYLLRNLLAEEERPHLKVAPTGIAAVAIGGSTIHRTFKIDIDTGFARQRWPEIEVVYIDEVSMMGLNTFEAAIHGAPNADFVFVGDMAQLPPVRDKYWFESEYMNQFDINFKRLSTQYRQQDDKTFANKLNLIRSGVADKSTMRWLYSNSTLEEENDEAVIVAYRNDTVRAINAENLIKLDGDVITSEAEYNGHMKAGDCSAEHVLNLKKGAEVIITVNDQYEEFQNGTRGIIEDYRDDRLAVKIKDSITTVWLDKHIWKMKSPQEITPARREEINSVLSKNSLNEITKETLRQALRTGIEYIVIGTTKQFPVKLAYAMTVHKSQGMTLDNVHIITNGFAGCYGIGYVALSRARDIDGVSFNKAPYVSDFKIDPRVKDFL